MSTYKYSVPFKKTANPIANMLLKAYLNYNYGMVVFSPEPRWIFKDSITADYIAKLTGETVTAI